MSSVANNDPAIPIGLERWSDGKLTKRGRAPGGQGRGLSRDLVVATALDYIDTNGTANLSMRDLAQQLGVEAMSLYHHVHGREDLLEGVVSQLLTNLTTIWMNSCGTTGKASSRPWRTKPDRSPPSTRTPSPSSPPATRPRRGFDHPYAASNSSAPSSPRSPTKASPTSRPSTPTVPSAASCSASCSSRPRSAGLTPRRPRNPSTKATQRSATKTASSTSPTTRSCNSYAHS